MLKAQIIGHLGKDAEVNMHGNKNVINFSVAHTEKYKDANGTVINKTVWVSCAWWTDRTTIAQYLRKGTQIYVDGQPEVKQWRTVDGENKAGLNLRVFSVQLLGGKREDDNHGNSNNNNSFTNTSSSFSDQAPESYDDLPF